MFVQHVLLQHEDLRGVINPCQSQLLLSGSALSVRPHPSTLLGVCFMALKWHIHNVHIVCLQLATDRHQCFCPPPTQRRAMLGLSTWALLLFGCECIMNEVEFQ